jgi:3-mercaptopyruvate sulfurtransferase SseA
VRSIILASAFLLIASGLLLTINGKHRGEAASLAAQGQTVQAQPTPTDGVRRVTVEELRAGLEKGTAIVIDVRSQEQYKAGHIKGALWILGDEIAGRIKELPKDKLVVAYCS